MSKFIITGWKSYALWPAGKICLANVQNITEDTHATEEIANGISRLLKRDGFGGDRKIFPIATWIIPVIEEVKQPDIRWEFEEAHDLHKECLNGYDKNNRLMLFAVHYSSGWTMIHPAIHHFNTHDLEEMKKTCEQYFANKSNH